MNIPFTITNKGVTVSIDGKPCSFATDHPSYDALVAAIDAGDEAEVRALADVRTNVKNRTFGRVEIRDNAIFIEGRPVTGRLVSRILEMVARGSAAVDGYVAFLDNLYNNPSKRAVDELWGFIEECDLPVTPDGCFLAYRFVARSYMDQHSGTVFNKPAEIMDDEELALYAEPQIGGRRDEVTIQVVDGVTNISCPRNMVDEDKDRTCSNGLHFCSYSYLPSYGVGSSHRVIVVKINPADVVAIPSDYNNAKGRAAAYTVITEIEDWTREDSRITPYYTDEYDEGGEYGDGEEEDLDTYDEDEFDDDVDYRDDTDEETLDELPPVESYETPEPIPTPGGATLNEAQVANIKALLRDRDMTMTAIADAYGVHRESIARIRDGRSWPHVNAAARSIWPVRFGS